MNKNCKPCFAVVSAVILLVGVNKHVSTTDYVAIDLNPNDSINTYALGASGGQQVGWSWEAATGNLSHALLWSGTAASAVDLHQFLPNGWIDSIAQAIDAQGNIVGIASDSAGNTHAILWQVVPEPATFVMLGMGALSLGFFWRRKRAG